MTEFKKTTALVDAMAACIGTMQAETSTPAAKKAALDDARKLTAQAEPSVMKMKKKADEKDPDKKTYGEGMTTKVLALYERFHEVITLVDETEPHVRQAYKVVEAEMAKQSEAEKEAARQAAAAAAALKAAEEVAAEAERERERQAAEQRERERAERHKKALEEAAAAKEAQRLEIEEEKKSRAQLEAFLNATPTRVLLRMGVSMLYEDCKAGRVEREGIHWLRTFDDTIRSSHQLVKNLAGHPDATTLKHLRYSNENFHRDILSRGNGALHMLYSLGYRPAGFGESQFLVLEEYDPVEKYDEWGRWWEEVKWTRDYLDTLVESLRDHRRGVARRDYDLRPNLPYVDPDTYELCVARQYTPYIPQDVEQALFS